MQYQTAHITPAPEIYGDFWFNSEPLAIHALDGQVVLLAFWDYTSRASLCALPFLKEWYRQYHDKGLVLIGIHSPDFPFAKNPEYVDQAIRERRIAFPVATDNERLMWEAYHVQELPTMYLIDRQGQVRYVKSGLEGFDVFERSIQSLLHDAGFRGDMPLLLETGGSKPVKSFFQRPTPDFTTGYTHGALGNVEGYSPELSARYKDPRMFIEGKFYADGVWLATRSSFQYDGENEEGYIVLRYSGIGVSAVLANEKVAAACVKVLQDDAVVVEENRGEDLFLDAEGNSCVKVHRPRLFALIHNKEFGEHVLKLVTSFKETAVYSLSFDVDTEPAPGLPERTFRTN